MPEPEVDKEIFQWHYCLLLNYHNILFLVLMVFPNIGLRLCPEKKIDKKRITRDLFDGVENPLKKRITIGLFDGIK